MLTDYKFKKWSKECHTGSIEKITINWILCLQVTFKLFDPKGFPESLVSSILSYYVIVYIYLLSISAPDPIDNIDTCQHDF